MLPVSVFRGTRGVGDVWRGSRRHDHLRGKQEVLRVLQISRRLLHGSSNLGVLVDLDLCA